MKICTRLLAVLAIGILDSARAACPPGDDDPLSRVRLNIDVAIVRIDTNGPGVCSGTGTGFFVNGSGQILTAGHVVPTECDDNTSIAVRWELTPGGSDLSASVGAKVIKRSTLDIAVLELSDKAAGVQYLKIAPAMSGQRLQALQNTCILLASHYFEQKNTYTSYAEIGSTSLVGDPRWALAGAGFNASRSGSPVVNAEGQVIAIFLARPGVDPNDRQRTIQNRAYVYPLGAVPQTDIDLQAMSRRDGGLPAFYTPPAAGHQPIPQRLETSFGISINESGFRTSPSLPTYVVRPDGSLSQFGSVVDAGVEILLHGGSVVRQTMVSERYAASPGYAFDPSTLRFRTDSRNPVKAPLPSQECSTLTVGGCYRFTDGNRSLELRIEMYPGFDGRNSWLDGELLIAQVRQ